ncbi:MAG TPA: hypothetical protein VLN59_17970, partial [Burkholderiales bacterium]|nr:hypothetical protein [Burkholderiales bacterium]
MEQRVDTARLREQILEQLTELLRRQKSAEAAPQRPVPTPESLGQLIGKHDLSELQRQLDQLHPADVAYILEALPLPERLIVWDLVKA